MCRPVATTATTLFRMPLPDVQWTNKLVSVVVVATTSTNSADAVSIPSVPMWATRFFLSFAFLFLKISRVASHSVCSWACIWSCTGEFLLAKLAFGTTDQTRLELEQNL